MNHIRDIADRHALHKVSSIIQWALPAIALGALLAFHHLPRAGEQIAEQPFRDITNSALFLLIGLSAIGLVLSNHEKRGRCEWMFVDNVTGLPSRRAVGSTLTLRRPHVNKREERYLLLVSMSNLAELAAILDSDVIDSLLACFAARLSNRLNPSRQTALRGRENRFFISALA